MPANPPGFYFLLISLIPAIQVDLPNVRFRSPNAPYPHLSCHKPIQQSPTKIFWVFVAQISRQFPTPIPHPHPIFRCQISMSVMLSLMKNLQHSHLIFLSISFQQHRTPDLDEIFQASRIATEKLAGVYIYKYDQ